MNKTIAVDAFNMLAGKKIGGGIHRDVFECKLLPHLVVKVEYETGYREFANFREQAFWDAHKDHAAIAQWLAPCEYLSPDARVLLQRRALPITADQMPDKLPEFLQDIKPENFGLLDGRIVCVDYAINFQRVPLRMRPWR